MGTPGNHSDAAVPQPASHRPEPEANFDEVLKQLQDVVEQLEQSDVPLEQSLRAFEKGVALARHGQQILDAAERRVEVLMRDDSTEPFEPTSDRQS